MRDSLLKDMTVRQRNNVFLFAILSYFLLYKVLLLHIILKMRRNLTNFVSKRFFSNNVLDTKFSAEQKYPPRILSGIQPTGSVHLGNYLGAIAQFVKLQNTTNNQNILFLADLHSMTIPFKPKQLTKNILELTATLLACGIDPQKTILFQQSSVREHTELCWHLSCISTMARLSHLPQFKEKSATLKDIPLGLFVYPVLQAADILTYKATQVPVGDDQTQQIQLVQELARMFNSRHGQTFPIPQSLILESSFNRVKSLRDPSKKMSKSDPDPKSRICLSDNPTDVVKNIKKAVTDFTSEVTYDPINRPGVANLVSIHSFVTNTSIDKIIEEAQNINTGQYKLLVADALVEFLRPIQDSLNQYLKNKHYLLDILNEGSQKASNIACDTLSEVRKKLGVDLESNKLNQTMLSVELNK